MKKNELLLKKYLSELEKIYHIKILKYKPGNIIANTHKQAFALIRYLDKIYQL